MTQIESIVISDVKHPELKLMNREKNFGAFLQDFPIRFRHRIGLPGSSNDVRHRLYAG